MSEDLDINELNHQDQGLLDPILVNGIIHNNQQQLHQQINNSQNNQNNIQANINYDNNNNSNDGENPGNFAQNGIKKPRKSSAHPSPPWKELNWMYTRKMLLILLDPVNDIMRRSLWPRMGEVSVGGSRIDYQTQLAKLTLDDWSNYEDVISDPKWYGNRVKDWMHKLPKIYVDSEQELRNAATASGASNDAGWQPTQTAATRCPVFSELQELLGGTDASNFTAERVALQLGQAGVASHGILDPNLNVAVGLQFSNGATLPRAQVLEKRYPQQPPSTPQYHYQIQSSSSAIQGSSKALGKRVRLDSEPLSTSSQEDSLPGQLLGDDSNDQIFVHQQNILDTPGTSSDINSNSRKVRKMDQYHERAKKRDEMEHERLLIELKAVEAEKERVEKEKERAHSLEQLRLEEAIVNARIRAAELEQNIASTLLYKKDDIINGM